MIKKFLEYIKEDSITTASFGSGTAVGGGATGSFTSASGVSVSGGDSASSFSTNSSGGMGAIISAQPSSTPGDVAGSTVGSGDIGSGLGVYTKMSGKKRKFKPMNKKKVDLDGLYILRFTEFDGVKNIKENTYTPPVKTTCQECGMEVEDCVKDMLGHVYLKHWAKPNNIMGDEEAREMVLRYFHKNIE